VSATAPDATYRCAVSSLDRDEPMAGTASTVRAFLLVENDGPWGASAWRDARMEPSVRDAVHDMAQRARVRPLMIRRHRGVGRVDGVRVFAAYAHPEQPWLETTVLDSVDQLLDLDLDALGRGASPGLTPTDEPVFCVCTHGRHDTCCAELGRPAAAALTSSHPEHTWEVSHVGGDRFAANVLVLPDGLYYGRVGDLDAPLLAERHLAGRLDLDRLRGRSGYALPVQAAELAVRRATGETRRDAVRLTVFRHEGDAESHVELDVGGAPYAVRLRRTTVAEEWLTCRARRASPATRHEVVSLTALG
jgi:hypothetical protein